MQRKLQDATQSEKGSDKTRAIRGEGTESSTYQWLKSKIMDSGKAAD